MVFTKEIQEADCSKCIRTSTHQESVDSTERTPAGPPHSKPQLLGLRLEGARRDSE